MEELIQLEPFVHQVGGHSGLLQLDDATICKPLDNRERLFYENMPPEMRDFTPRYQGVVQVAVQEDCDGYMSLAAHPPNFKGENNKPLVSSTNSVGPRNDGAQLYLESDSTTTVSRHRFHMSGTGHIKVEGSDVKVEKKGMPITFKQDVSRDGPTPWALRWHGEQLARMTTSTAKSTVHEYLVLENLISHFKLPCVLDLKMGTRQHGDNVSQEKQQLLMDRCANTTSCKLGLRLCGMKVYQANTGTYLCHNKYHGRTLTEEGVKETLFTFLHNGHQLRVDAITQIMERLTQMHDLLSKQNTFRFYSSSLLIMYDGCYTSGSAVPNDNDCVVEAVYDNDAGSDSPPLETTGAQSSSTAHQSTNHSPLIDVRMIDFAHTTHEAFPGDRVTHTGPDKGYLFGLKNLMRIFEEIKRDHMESSGARL